MISRKVDQLLLLLGMVLVFISSYQLFFLPLTGSGKGTTLGTLIQAESVVKIKNSTALDWRDAYSGNEVLAQQLVFTDEDSSAEIKFQEGHKLSIDENSLIRLSSFKNGPGVDLRRGLLRTTVEADKPLIVEMNGAELKLTGKNADVQINLQENGGEIGVIGGEVTVEKGGRSETIDTKSALKVTGENLERQRISLTPGKPSLNEIFYTIEEKANIRFDWTPKVAAEVILALDSSFKKIMRMDGTGSVSANLSGGTYYWKVKSADGISLVSSFKIHREVAPEILRPKDGESLRFASGENLQPEIFLQWKKQKSHNYLVEWGFQNIQSQLVQGSGLLVPVGESGQLRWRVKVEDGKRPLAQWSDWQGIDVKLVGPPNTPTNLLPEKMELQSFHSEAIEVKLSWENQPEIEMEVIDPKNHKETLALKGTSLLLKVNKIGTYSWRVRGSDEFGRYSPWSEWKEFEVTDNTLDSDGGVQRIQLKRPDQSVTFNWQSSESAKTIFELADKNDFSQVIISREVVGDEVKVVIPKTGEFFWRSRQISEDGTVIYGKPKRVLIEPAPAPEKPQKLPDMEVPLEWRETHHIPQKSWFDFILSSAHASEFKGVAKIQLPPDEDAKRYVVRIFHDDSGKELVLERKLDTPVLEWENVRPGHYYWQYAVVDYWDRQGPFSDLSSLTVTGEEPTLPVKPKLLKPIRATEVDKKSIGFEWTDSEKNQEYILEISSAEDFSRMIHQKKVTESAVDLDGENLKEGLYYWRITAISSSQREVKSNTGRFSIPKQKPLERIVVADQKGIRTKHYRHQAFIAWAPSSDSFEFEGDGQKGKIDGTVLNSVEIQATYFTDKLFYSAEILRQSGEVFEGESYLFQRLLAGATWKFKTANHLWGPGLSLGLVSGQSYNIDSGEVSAESVSGAIYGPHLQGFYDLSSQWELQGKVAYFLGEIPHLDLTMLAKREFQNFRLFMGPGVSGREYADNEGSQFSLRLILGLGKEF